MTKAVILSGGFGTRLRPLTCTIPKTLIPIVNVPLMEITIKKLRKAGVKEIILAVSVMSDQLKYHFGDGSKFDVKITFTNEKEPMGTAGAVKLAEKLIDGDNFFVLNGDVINDIDYAKMIEAHNKYGGLATMTSYVVQDPRRYGTLIINEENRIEQFIEKQPINENETDIKPMPVNAGTYLLENEVLSTIEPGRPVSIEREVFTTLAEKGKLYAFEITGFWKDIGLPEEFFVGNFMMLDALYQENNKNQDKLIDSSSRVAKNVTIIPPVAIDSDVQIGENSKIGPNVIIGKESKIGNGTEISNSILFHNSKVSQGAKINYAIIADYCILGEKVVIDGTDKSLVVLSTCVNVIDNVHIKSKNVSYCVCHHETIKESLNT